MQIEDMIKELEEQKSGLLSYPEIIEEKFAWPKQDRDHQYWLQNHVESIPTPDDLKEVKRLIYNLTEQQKLVAGEESDLHNLGMLDGMLVIQAAVEGNPWPL